MRLTAILAFAALASPAAAQTPQPGTLQLRIDVSPAGEAVLKRYLGVPDPVVAQQTEKFRSLDQQMIAVTNAPRLDLVRMREIMRQQEQVRAAMLRHSNDRMLAMLGELPEPDRLKFVRSVNAASAGTKPAGQ